MSKELSFYEKVAKVQKELKAPKSQRNKFGNYNYRNQEDILEAVKPLLGDLVLTVNDEIVEIAGRVYVKATATITDGEKSLSNTAFAREPQEQKGMSDSQVTGAASSYARKYSLNGLFLIDDTKDADSDEVTALTKGEKAPEKTTPAKTAPAKAETKEAAPEKTETKTEAKPAGRGGWSRPKPAQTTQSTGGDLY